MVIRVNRRAAVCHPNREMRGKGLCSTCYASYRRSGKTKFKDITSKWEEEKELSMAASVIGREERAKKRRDSNPFLYKSYWKRYRITQDDFHQMVLEQVGCCKICDEQLTNEVVDHCHVTKVVRGLLCHKCNILVGNLENNTQEILEKAKLYIMTQGTMEDIKW